jgi:tetratricopeptide (TPR) repeat protein
MDPNRPDEEHEPALDSAEPADPSLLPTAGRAELSAAETTGHAMLSMPTETSPTTSSPRKTSARLEPGEKLANRFRIVRFIAKGGMGEVYEAEDEVVRVKLALKTILPAIAADPEMVEQLKLEMRSARKVTHPNVCRLIEVFQDDARRPALLFLTMELVEGEPLSDVLRHGGPMPFAQFLTIASQIAAGLDAVHRADIVHQDFKTSNVLIVKSGSSTRAVVTDFGLAVNLKASGRDRGLAGGTPAYMAPEQVDGDGDIGPSADIYAFGVVLYELLTNRFPIAGNTRQEIQQRKLTERPIPPSHYRPDIPKPMERAVLKCLERDPKDRFANVLDVVAALEGRAEKRRKRIAGASVAFATLLLVATVGGYSARRWFLSHRTPTVAVVGLQNVNGGADITALGTELTELLSANLARSKGLNAVPADDVSLAQGEFPVATSQNVEREDLSGFRRAIGADYLIVGKYSTAQNANQVAFDLKIEGPNGGALGAAIHEEGPERDAKSLAADAASKIRQRLGTQLLSDAETEEVGNLYPQNDEARRLYFEALAKSRALNGTEAAALLKKAANAEPDNASIHSAYAEALNLLKNIPAARTEAKRAEELASAGHLPPEFVAMTEARSAELNNDWKTAVQKLDGLFTLSRENLQFGLLLSSAQTSGGQPADALKTLDRLGKLPLPAGADPRIQIAAAETYSSMGKYGDEILAARHAQHDAKARTWRMMEARAALQLCWAYQRRGDSAQAIASCNEAKNIFSDFGDGVSGAVTLNNIANWLVSRGQYQEAKDAYERVLTIVTKAQSQRDMAGAQLNLATTLFNLGDSAAARQHLNAAIPLAMASGDSYDEARARVIDADLLRSNGDINGALDQVRRARDIAHAAGDEDAEAYALNNLALYLQDSGDLTGAFESAQAALAIRQRLGVPASVAATQAALGDLYFERGDFEKARKGYADALALRDPSEKAQIAQLRLSMAQVDMQAGNLDAALASAKNAAAEFEQEKDIDEQADANALIVRVLSKQQDLAGAREYLDRILHAPPQDQDVQTACAIARGEFLIALGKAGEAVALLKPMAGIGQKRGYQDLELELVLGRAEMLAKNDRPQAASTLQEVRKQAEKLGLQRLASEATDALRRTK